MIQCICLFFLLNKDLKIANCLDVLTSHLLKDKLLRLESSDSSTSTSVIFQVLQEIFDQERCSSNVLIYKVLELSSELTSQRITVDKVSFEKIVLIFYDNLSISFKLIRLGKVWPDNVRPLKIILCLKKMLQISGSFIVVPRKVAQFFLQIFVSPRTKLYFSMNCCEFVIQIWSLGLRLEKLVYGKSTLMVSLRS